MDLLLSEEQRMLRESARRFLTDVGGAERLRHLRGTEHGFDRQVLRAMAEQGWLGILVPEERGGLGLGMTEAALLLEQAGRALAPEPVGASIVTAAALAACGGDDGLLERVVAGESLVVPAIHTGPAGGEIRARPANGDTVALDGTCLGVVAAAAADGMLVAAAGPDGPLLCHVEAGAEGLGIATRRTVDGATFGDVAFEGVPARPLAAWQNRGFGRPEAVRDGLLVAASAELLGAMDAALEMTLDYLRTREQFGRPARRLPGPAAPRGRRFYAHRRHKVAALPDRRQRRRHRPGDGRGAQGTRLGFGAPGRQVGDPDARRHRLHRRARRGALPQARDDALGLARQRRRPARPLRRGDALRRWRPLDTPLRGYRG